MRTLSANLTTENDKDNNLPVVEIEFSGITEKYSSGTFQSISANHKKLVKNFEFTFPEIDLMEGLQSNARMRFSLLDDAQTVTSAINSNNFVDRGVIAKIGDQNIVIGDFFNFPSMKIKSPLDLDESFQGWLFTAEAILTFLNDDIFKSIPQTNLSGDYLKGVTTTLNGGDFSGFINPANMPSKIGTKAYIAVDDEIIKYEAKSGNTFTTITRGQFGTEDTDHFDGAEIKQFFAFDGVYPTDALLYWLLTTSDGSGHAFYDLASFDSAFNDMGLGLSSSEVNIEEIERLGYKWFFDSEACWYLGSHETKRALDFIKESILKSANLFFRIDSTNKINVGIVDFFEFISFRDTGETIDQTKSKRPKTYSIDLSNLINEIHFQHDVNPLSGQHLTTTKLEYDTSKTLFQATENPYIVKTPLLKNGVSSANMAWHTARRLFYVYGKAVSELEIDVDPRYWLYEPYDTITYSNNKIPDLRNGGVGISDKFVITGQSIRPIGSNRGVTYQAIGLETYIRTITIPDGVFTTVIEGSISDTSVTFRSPADTTQSASDGNHTFGSDQTMTFMYFDIRVTPPNTGTTEHWISLRLKQFDNSSILTGTVTDKEKILRYNSGDSTAFTVRLIKICDDATIGIPSEINVRTVSVQWYDASASAVSGERPTVEFVEFGYNTNAFGIADFSVV